MRAGLCASRAGVVLSGVPATGSPGSHPPDLCPTACPLCMALPSRAQVRPGRRGAEPPGGPATLGSRAGMGVLRAGKKGGSKGVVARAVREGRPRPFFIHSPPGCRGEGAMPRYCREPTRPSGRAGKCTCQDFPRASSTARCPSSWETRGRRGAGAGGRGSTRASGEDATARLGPTEETPAAEGGQGV